LKSSPRDPSALWLDKNENLDSALAETLGEVLASVPQSALATYPEAGELYRKLARWIGVSPESLILTPGSDGAIRLVFEAFVEQGDAVIHTIPTFAMYPVYCQMFGSEGCRIDYESTGVGPRLEPSALIKALRQHRPKLLCLPNPDSPTGTVLAPDVLRDLLAECERTGTVLLLDEAYHPFYEWSAASWIKDSPNLIVARTFAKAWGAAGLRIGYAMANPTTIALLHKMRPMYEVGTFAVEFMSRMMDRVDEMLKSVSRIQEGKAHFLEEMRSLGFDVLPTNGNFVHVAFGDLGQVIHPVLSKRVLYRPTFDHPCLHGYSRFSVAPRSIMSQVADIIKEAAKVG